MTDFTKKAVLLLGRLPNEAIFDVIYHEDIDEYWKSLKECISKNEIRFFPLMDLNTLTWYSWINCQVHFMMPVNSWWFMSLYGYIAYKRKV